MADTPRFSRVLKVLEYVARAERPPRIADLVGQSGLPKATVHRICRLLKDQGYLDESATGKGLVPGRGLASLAESVFANRAQDACRHAILKSLARQIGETCNISVPNGMQMLYSDRVETEWPLKVQLPAGTRVPLHCTASGKLYLSTLPAARRRRILARLDLDRRTPNTITDVETLEAGLRQIARSGMGTDDEEFIEGMIAISVPVTDRAGRLFATLSFHAPVFRMSLEKAKGHADMLRVAARELATDMGSGDLAGGE